MSRGGLVTKQRGLATVCGSVRDSLWPGQIQQGFHPKRGAAAASSVCLGGLAGFLPLWLRWGISSTMPTWHGFFCVLEGPRCDGKRDPATPLGDFNLDMQPHTGPTRALVGLFGFLAPRCCEAASSLIVSGQHNGGQPWP